VSSAISLKFELSSRILEVSMKYSNWRKSLWHLRPRNALHFCLFMSL